MSARLSARAWLMLASLYSMAVRMSLLFTSDAREPTSIILMREKRSPINAVGESGCGAVVGCTILGTTSTPL